MRIKMNFNGSNSVEHRHIMTNLFSLIAPYLDQRYPKYPERLSMRLHQETAKLILELHPNIDTVYAPPLKSMAEIMQKSGFANFDFSDKNQNVFEWIYDYGALSNGIQIKDLYKYFEEKIRVVGLIPSDFENCTIIEAKESLHNVNISFWLLQQISDQLKLKH